VLWLDVGRGVVGHRAFEVWQTVAQTFVLKVQHTKWQKDWTLKTSSEKLALTCVYMHKPFAKKGFTSSMTMKYWREQDFQSLLQHESLHFGLVNFKCLMSNHARFDTQLEHVLASGVHA